MDEFRENFDNIIEREVRRERIKERLVQAAIDCGLITALEGLDYLKTNEVTLEANSD